MKSNEAGLVRKFYIMRNLLILRLHVSKTLQCYYVHISMVVTPGDYKAIIKVKSSWKYLKILLIELFNKTGR